ncbi:MAG: D-tyrosyl-tRNA(Tyr) deacylase [Dehalococcoidia bacterium]|nr:D-tyrosyl-tRNA(Tyr) deacylase [Dehalococcoidia bacterium]
MRLLLQRVHSASVEVDGNLVSSINTGLLCYVGFSISDTEKDMDYIVDKTLSLRVFSNDEGKFDISVSDYPGEILLVSQFTLYADIKKGRRPSFTEAMGIEEAKSMFNNTVERFKQKGINISAGIFQANMDVKSINDGPVTIMIDSIMK